MAVIYKILSWIGGIFCLLMAVLVHDSVVSSLLFVIIAMILIPISRSVIQSKTNRMQTLKERVFTIFLLFITAIAFDIPDPHAKKFILFLTIALILIPISRAVIRKMNQIKNLRAIVYTMVILCVVAGYFYMPELNIGARLKLAAAQVEADKKSMEEKRLNDLKEDYQKNKGTIIAEINQKIAKLDIRDAIRDIEKYQSVANGELAPLLKEANEKKRIKDQFSDWDGSHINLTKAIKNSMNDPKSYEHVSTYYIVKKDHISVKTTFRGKNAFGGTVLNTVFAKVDMNGNIIEIKNN